jgi:hypothetical protein
VGAAINVFVTVLPMLKDYFTKNKGLNTVSGGFLGAFGVLVMQGMQSGNFDLAVSWVQNQGETGVIVGCMLVGLRTAVFAYNAIKSA